MDAQHYVRLSDDLAHTETPGVPEDDNLEGARHELKIGYGQSKWVSEKLLMEAAKRGLAVNIVRPGYIVGDSVSGGRHTLGSWESLWLTADPHSHEYGRLYMAFSQGLLAAWSCPRHQQHG